MNRTALKAGLVAVAGVLGAVPFAAGAVYQRVQTRRDDQLYPGLGEQVVVDGRTVHVRRIGTHLSGPTVLFEAGLSSPLEMWTWVQAAVGEVAPTISYDRAGIGWSERGALPRTAAQITDELERLLEVLEVAGPLVLVGHSYGGMLLRAFAQRHPDRVAGVVLIDAAHPEQLVRSARQRLGLPVMRVNVRTNLFWARFGRTRYSKTTPDSQVAGLPETAFNAAIARMMSTRNWKATDDEIEGWLSHVVDEVRESTLPAAVPLFVLSAEETGKADPVHRDLQRDLATLSSAGIHQMLPGTTHLGILCMEAAAVNVAAAVLDVVDAAGTGRAPKLVEIESSGDSSD